MERFKNYGLWLAIGSFAVIALETFGFDIDLGKYEQLYHAFLSILVMAGILNNRRSAAVIPIKLMTSRNPHGRLQKAPFLCPERLERRQNVLQKMTIIIWRRKNHSKHCHHQSYTI